MLMCKCEWNERIYSIKRKRVFAHFHRLSLPAVSRFILCFRFKTDVSQTFYLWPWSNHWWLKHLKVTLTAILSWCHEEFYACESFLLSCTSLWHRVMSPRRRWGGCAHAGFRSVCMCVCGDACRALTLKQQQEGPHAMDTRNDISAKLQLPGNDRTKSVWMKYPELWGK